jgi:hypothetical protein
LLDRSLNELATDFDENRLLNVCFLVVQPCQDVMSSIL